MITFQKYVNSTQEVEIQRYLQPLQCFKYASSAEGLAKELPDYFLGWCIPKDSRNFFQQYCSRLCRI